MKLNGYFERKCIGNGLSVVAKKKYAKWRPAYSKLLPYVVKIWRGNLKMKIIVKMASDQSDEEVIFLCRLASPESGGAGGICIIFWRQPGWPAAAGGWQPAWLLNVEAPRPSGGVAFIRRKYHVARLMQATRAARNRLASAWRRRLPATIEEACGWPQLRSRKKRGVPAQKKLSS
jgi:hypothetical protein